MTKKWSPNSWRAKKAKHNPHYQNEEELNDVLYKIHFVIGKFIICEMLDLTCNRFQLHKLNSATIGLWSLTFSIALLK